MTLTREDVEFYRARTIDGPEWRNRICDAAILGLETQEKNADAVPQVSSHKDTDETGGAVNPAESAPGVVVPRDFLESARCPTCDGRGWYISAGIGSSDPEQEQCQWCFERNSMLAATQPAESAPDLLPGLREDLQKSLRSSLLFDDHNEPLNDYGLRLVRVILQRIAQLEKEKPPVCPRCGSDGVLKLHREGDLTLPECNYLQCAECDFQWGHG